MKREPLVIYTVGHSTPDLPAFLELLQSYGVEQLVDVRTMPRSRRTHSTTPTLFPSLSARQAPATSIFAPGAACGTRRATRSTPAGETRRSGSSPITCRRQNSRGA